VGQVVLTVVVVVVLMDLPGRTGELQETVRAVVPVVLLVSVLLAVPVVVGQVLLVGLTYKVPPEVRVAYIFLGSFAKRNG
jgi:hypothetical protein